MKRLIRKAEPITLYHGTNLLSLDNILRTGISAGFSENSAWTYTSLNHTFYATTFDRALFYGINQYSGYGSRINDCIVVLEIDFDTDYLEPDKDDFPNANTWQESDEISNQVAFSGSVLANQIINIEFYDKFRKKILECDSSEYLSDPNAVKNKVYDRNMEKRGEMNSKKAEEILDEMNYLGKKISNCNEIHKYGKDEKFEVMLDKLNKQYIVIYKIVEKINDLIAQYNEETNEPIPFVLVEEITDDYSTSEQPGLKTLLIEWSGFKMYTTTNYDIKSSRYIAESFEIYMKRKQYSKIAKNNLKIKKHRIFKA